MTQSCDGDARGLGPLETLKKKSKGLPLRIHWPLTFIWWLTLIIETCCRKDWTAPKQLESNNKRAADVLKPYFWGKKNKKIKKCLLFCKIWWTLCVRTQWSHFSFCFVFLTAASKITHAEILRHRRRLIHDAQLHLLHAHFHPSSKSHTERNSNNSVNNIFVPPQSVLSVINSSSTALECI